MEAPLKFTAPNLTIAEGLQIGRIVFGMLNHCEWFFLVIILITWFIKKPGRAEGRLITAVGIILLLETFWLLPALDHRAKIIIAGGSVAANGLHWCYIILEIVKVPLLLSAALKGFARMPKNTPVLVE